MSEEMVKVEFAIQVIGPTWGQRFYSIKAEMPAAPTPETLFVVNPDWGARTVRTIFYDMTEQTYEVEFRSMVVEDTRGIDRAEWIKANLEPEWVGER